MFQFPGFAFVTLCIQVQIPSLITGNPKPDVPRDPQSRPASKFQLSKVGCPIRKSADQRLFAPPHSISQRTTSFIASYRQGIHQMPFRHLITLISNAHLCLPAPIPREGYRDQVTLGMMDIVERPDFHQDRPGTLARLTAGPSPSTHQALRPNTLSGDASRSRRPRYIPSSRCHGSNRTGPIRNRAETCSLQTWMPDRSVTARSSGIGGARRDRTDDLKLAKLPLSQLSYGPKPCRDHCAQTVPIHQPCRRRTMVGLGRFELPTSRLSSARSNQLSYRPLTRMLNGHPLRHNKRASM